jgi:hypothetical protein
MTRVRIRIIGLLLDSNGDVIAAFCECVFLHIWRKIRCGFKRVGNVTILVLMREIWIGLEEEQGNGLCGSVAGRRASEGMQ